MVVGLRILNEPQVLVLMRYGSSGRSARGCCSSPRVSTMKNQREMTPSPMCQYIFAQNNEPGSIALTNMPAFVPTQLNTEAKEVNRIRIGDDGQTS